MRDVGTWKYTKHKWGVSLTNESFRHSYASNSLVCALSVSTDYPNKTRVMWAPSQLRRAVARLMRLKKTSCALRRPWADDRR
jgi:hypothetical protein